MPDVDGGAHDRAARGRVDDLQAEQQRHARPALRDVPAPLLAGDVVRALRLLRGEDARDGARRDARGTSLGVGGAPAERGEQEAAETNQ
jgi:hypothetical protein